MPSVKDFEKNKKNKKTQSNESTMSNGNEHEESNLENAPNKRRPAKESTQEVHLDGHEKTNDNDDVNPDHLESFAEKPKFRLNFPYSYLLRNQVPKTFDVVEKVAGDWVNNGDFEGLPLGHPLAQVAAAKALTQAKKLEGKILSSTPVTLAKIGLEYAKSKLKK